MTVIQPIQKSKLIDYGNNEIQNFWLDRETPPFNPDQKDFSTEIETLIRTANNAVICIQSEDLTDQRLIKNIFDAAERNNRIFLLVNVWNDRLDPLRGKCLIRYDLRNTGSFMLINPNTNASSGVFFTGHFSEEDLNFSSNLLFNLDAEQTGILYRHFCYHFWNTAAKENISGKDRDTSAAPTDVFPCTNNFCDPDFVKKQISSSREGIRILTNAIQNREYFDFSTLKYATIVTSFSGNNNAVIPSLKEAGNRILAVNKEISLNIISASVDTWIFPKTVFAEEDIFFAFKANTNQAVEINALLEEYAHNAEYEFFGSEQRKNLSEKMILSLGESSSAVLLIEAEKQILLPDNGPCVRLISYNELENLEPNFSDSGDAVQIRYTWRNMPFYLPQDSGSHPLYSQWEKEIGKIFSFLNNLLSRIDSEEKKEYSLAKALSRFFLGKKTRFNALKNEIDGLKKTDFSRLEAQNLKNTFERISAINRQIEGDIAEIAEENRKAKLDEEIDAIKAAIEKENADTQVKREELVRKEKEKQDAADAFCSSYIEWKKEILNADIAKQQETVTQEEAELADKEKTLAALDAEKEKLQEELSAQEAIVEQKRQFIKVQEAEKKTKILSFAQEYTADEKGFTKIKGELEELSGKENREKNPAIADAAAEKRKTLQSIIEKDEAITRAKQEELDYKEKEKSDAVSVFCSDYIEWKKAVLNADIAELQEAVARAETELSAKKKTLDSFEDVKKEKQRKEFAGQESALKKKKKELAALESEKESRIKSFAQEYTADEKGFTKIKGELEELSGKENREKNPAVSDAAAEKRKTLQSIDEQSIFIQKTRDEIENLENGIKAKNHEIGQKEETQKADLYLNTLLSRINATDKKEKNPVKKLLQFFGGKKARIAKFKKEIEIDLNNAGFSNLEAQKLKEKINKIIEGDITEIDTEDRKAKLDEAINALKAAVDKDGSDARDKREELERKEKEKRNAVSAFFSSYIDWKKTILDADISKQQETVEKEEAELADNKKAFNSVEDAKKEKLQEAFAGQEASLEKKRKELTALESEKESIINAFAQEYTADEKGLAKINDELETFTGKKNREKNPAVSDAAAEKRKALQSIIEKDEGIARCKQEELERKEKEKRDADAFCSDYIEWKKAVLNADIAELQEAVTRAETELSAKKKTLKTEDAKKEKLQKEFAEQEASLEKKRKELAALESEKESRINVFAQEYTADEKGLAKINDELETFTGKKNREKNPAVSDAAAEKRKALQSIKEQSIFIQKIQNEIEKLEKGIAGKKRDIEQKEKEKNSAPASKPKQESSLNAVIGGNSGKSNTGDKNGSLAVPNLQRLPQTGKLYQLDNKSYLAIQYWEEFDPGKSEAGRFDAILCAEKEGV